MTGLFQPMHVCKFMCTEKMFQFIKFLFLYIWILRLSLQKLRAYLHSLGNKFQIHLSSEMLFISLLGCQMCVCVCVSVYLYVYGVYVNAEIHFCEDLRSRLNLISSSVASPSGIFKDKVAVNWELTYLAKLAGQQHSMISLSLTVQHWNYRCVSLFQRLCDYWTCKLWFFCIHIKHFPT